MADFQDKISSTCDLQKPFSSIKIHDLKVTDRYSVFCSLYGKPFDVYVGGKYMQFFFKIKMQYHLNFAEEAPSSLWLVGWVGVSYSISTRVDYIMPNPVYKCIKYLICKCIFCR